MPPERTIELFNQGKSKLVNQYTEENNLWLNFYSEDYPGITTTYMFTREKLVSIYFEYDTALFVPPSPHGEKRIVSGQSCWIDHQEKSMTTRKYKGSLIVDIIMPLPKPR